MKLYTEGTSEKWNAFLNDCYKKQNIDRLMSTRIGLQVGMSTLAKKKLNSDKMTVIYLRWLRSVEDTARAIIRDRHPMPGDRGFKKDSNAKWADAKKKRDVEFENFILRSSY